MKLNRNKICLLLMMIMILTVTIPANAADVKIEISDSAVLEEHVFTAYQIFTGTQTGDEKDTALGDIQWGSGVNVLALMDALTDQKSELKDDFSEIDYTNHENLAASAAKVAKIMEGWPENSKKADIFAKIVYSHISENGIVITENTTSLESGYYLISDTSETLEDGSAYNAALLQVTGDTIMISAKTDAPSLEKKVKENTKYAESAESTVINGVIYDAGYNDVADYNIGDTVPFTIYSKVPDMKYYDIYQFEIHDTLSEGLTLLDESAKGFTVTIGEKTLLRETEYKIEKDGQSFVIKIENLKSITEIQKGDIITVNYSARLNSDAVTGNVGNSNEAYLEYSNNPNDHTSTGKTPADKTLIYTYALDLMKVDGNSLDGNIYNTKLSGAEFVLYQIHGEQTEYIELDANGKVCGWSEIRPASGNLKTGDDGTFLITGLDDGVYYLEETKAPSGYNLLTSPVKLTIAAATVHGQHGAGTDTLSDIMIKVDANLTDDFQEESGMFGDVSTGTVNVMVENYKGAVLPSTGGNGTTMLYGIGGMFVVVSVIYFIICRRKNVKNNSL